MPRSFVDRAFGHAPGGLLLQLIDLLDGLLISLGVIVDDVGRFLFAIAGTGGNDVDHRVSILRLQRRFTKGFHTLEPLFQRVARLSSTPCRPPRSFYSD